MGSLWPILLSLLALVMAAYAVHLGFSAVARAENAEQHAADSADLADVALRANGIARGGTHHLRRVASSGTDNQWTPPNG